MKSGIVLFAVAAVCLLLGFWMGQRTSGSPVDEAAIESDSSGAITLLPDTIGSSNREDLVSLSSQSGNAEKLELHRRLEGLNGQEIAQLIDEVFAKTLYEKEKKLLSSLYVKWFDLDREAALQNALSRTGEGSVDVLKTIFARWAEVSPHEAWDRLEGTEKLPKNSRWSIGNIVLEEIAKSEPELALELSLNPLAGGAAYSPSSVFRVWAQSDPAAAASAIQKIGLPWSRAREFRTVAAVWAKEDAEAAWEWAKGLSNSNERSEALESVMGTAIEKDWRSAVRLYEELPVKRGNDRVLKKLLTKMSEESPVEAYEFATEHAKGAGSVAEFQGLWWNWAQQDPEGALEVAERDQNDGDQNWSETFRIIIDVVARTDVEKATRMMGNLKDPNAYESAASAIAYKLMSRDVKQAVDWAVALPPGNARESVLASALGTWGMDSPGEASEFALELPGSKEREASLKSIAKAWAGKDAVEALKWADSHLEDPETRKSTLPYMIGRLANTNVEKAAEWVMNQSENEVRANSSSYLISEWVRMDFSAAGKWLNQLEKGKSRDAAVDTYSRHIFKQDTDAARGWIESISATEKRNKLLGEMAVSLSRTKPESARDWLQTTSLSPSEQSEVLKKMNK